MVAEARGTGATGIKVYAAVSAAVLRPLVAEAHRQGLRVWAHAALSPWPGPARWSRQGWTSRPTRPCWCGKGCRSCRITTSGKKPDPIVAPDSPRITALLDLMVRCRTMPDATLFVVADREEQEAWSAAVVHEAWRKGVAITSGTDSLGDDKPGALPEIHEELRLLVERAGLTPLAALSAATLNGARALGIEQTRGTIAPGKAADLVVLSADPTDRHPPHPGLSARPSTTAGATAPSTGVALSPHSPPGQLPPNALNSDA